jgi:Macrocin-O-methyltransferase (TylF)
MIELPDPARSWEYENGFYLTCETARIGKLLAHYELFKMVHELPGAIVECGVFKGASLVRFAAFRDLLGSTSAKQIVGFDTFAAFPATGYDPDAAMREHLIEVAGSESIARSQLREILERRGIDRCVELVEGDILQTVPAYVEQHPELRIALLNLDTDIYEPARVILEHLYPRIVPGGLLVLDDYGVFPGESDALDAYFAGNDVEIRAFPFSLTPAYVRKPGPSAALETPLAPGASRSWPPSGAGH